jgi:hypothetical protein
MGLLTIFVLLTNVLLINLLIAQMTNTYERINNHSFAEWSLTKARNAKKLLRVHEKNPLCMLPSPLNFITFAIWITGLHNYFLEHMNISLAGTVSDYFLM